MTSKRPLTKRGVQKLTERERSTGLDPEDAAARWLQENDRQPPPAMPKAATKSKALHRWRQQQQQRNRTDKPPG
jgi:hypothetical protein